MARKAGKGTVRIIGVVKGLVSEGQMVESQFADFGPDIVAVSVHDEGLRAMGDHVDSASEGAGLDNVEEEFYVKALAKFGEVSKPPPAFVSAMKLARDAGIEIKAVDFNDEEFTELFCHHVSGVEWLKQPARQRKLARYKFKAGDAKEFALEWDRLVNAPKGMRKIEEARAARISEELNELAKKHEKILAVVDYERSAEISRLLKNAGCPVEMA